MATYGFSERDFGRVGRAVKKIEGMADTVARQSGGPLLVPQPVSITFRNDSSEQAPQFGVMRVTGGEFNVGIGPYLLCDKPSATYAAQYVVNGCYPVSAGGYFGQCYTTGCVRVAYDSGTPAIGELWGPKAGQWTLSKGATGTGGTGTTLRADWGVVVAGIADSTNKILLGKVVPYGRARRCRGKLTDALTTTTASIAVDEITTVSQGWCPADETTDQETVYNVYTTKGFAGPNNGVCQFEWNEAQSRWEFYDTECT